MLSRSTAWFQCTVSRRRPAFAELLAATFALAAALATVSLADSYAQRLPDHRGLFLTDAPNRASAEPAPRPRRTVVVLVDGLRGDAARGMASIEALGRVGSCGPTHVGELSVSRPVYASISSGVEVDRSGVRHNDEMSPASVESIWQVARAAGLRVRGESGLGWWRELFPDGFDDYHLAPDSRVDLPGTAELAELTLIHVLYVDDAGHTAGADSSAYRAAVARVDHELGGLIERLDRSRDLLVVTSDHGHSDRGGHGGTAPEVAWVWTCWSGPSIAVGRAPPLPARAIAPTLSVLLGLPFPRHMRTDAELDALWSLPAMAPVYLAARRADLARMRQANQAQLDRWLGGDHASWAALYRREASRHHRMAALALGVIALCLGLSLRIRKLGTFQGAASLAWMAALAGSCTGWFAWVRGSFDFSAINLRGEFILAGLSVCIGAGAALCWVHLLAWGRPRRLLLDLTTLLLTIAAIDVAHVLVYGWPVGFPLPGRMALFYPYFAAPMAVGLAPFAVLAAACVVVSRSPD